MSDSDNDEGFLEGEIVDNIFNVKGASAHLEIDFEQATKYVRGLAGSAKQEDLLYFYARYCVVIGQLWSRDLKADL